jgi:hypothetical protein
VSTRRRPLHRTAHALTPLGAPLRQRRHDGRELCQAICRVRPRQAAQRALRAPASLALLAEVNGRWVLYAGCGPGICSAILADRGALVHAFDASPTMVELARERCRGGYKGGRPRPAARLADRRCLRPRAVLACPRLRRGPGAGLPGISSGHPTERGDRVLDGPPHAGLDRRALPCRASILRNRRALLERYACPVPFHEVRTAAPLRRGGLCRGAVDVCRSSSGQGRCSRFDGRQVHPGRLLFRAWDRGQVHVP